MIRFLIEAGFTLGALVALGLVGGFVLLPFRDNKPFVLLLAPMCGLLILPMLTILIYGTGKLSFGHAAAVALGGAIALTILTIGRWRPRRGDVLVSVPLAIMIALLVTGISTVASVHNGSASLLAVHGSDQVGYANTADWILDHWIHHGPQLDAERPYEVWPAMVMQADRLGGFVALALAAWSRDTSSLFAYDFACAVILSVAVLGIAAAFARSSPTLILIAFGLLIGFWFELGRSGYFGKILAYPACLFVLALLLTDSFRDVRSVPAIAALTIATASLHSGFGTAFMLLGVGSVFIVVRGIFEFRTDGRLRETERAAAAFGIAILLALAATGMFARVFALPFHKWPELSWSWLILRIFEVQNLNLDLPASSWWLSAIAILALALQIAIVAAGIVVREPVSIALAGGPLMLMAILFLTDDKWIFLELAGSVYAMALCGIAYLSDDVSVRARQQLFVSVMAISLAFIAVRMPRLPITLDIYVLNPPPERRYAASDFDGLAAAIGLDRIVEIDIEEGQAGLFPLIEFTRRGIKVQFSPRAWRFVFSFKGWPPPSYSRRPDFRLTHVHDQTASTQPVYVTPQYRLTRLSHIGP